MRKILALFIFAFATVAAQAQGGNALVIAFPGVPSGSCGTFKFALNTANGDFYDCLSGSWNKVNGGGGSAAPTGTGFIHVTSGTQDGASKTVDVSSSDITGALKAASFPALTGDVTTSAGSLTTALANIPAATPVVGRLVNTNVAAPSTPASGKTATYVDSTTKKLCTKDDAGTITCMPYAIQKDFVAAVAQNAAYSLSGSCGSDCPTPSAPNSNTNVNTGTAAFSAGASNSLTYQLTLPDSWTGTNLIGTIWWTTTTGDNTKSVVWNLATSCPAAGATVDAAYNTAGTVTTAANASANVLIKSTITLTGAGLTGCAAGGLVNVKLTRPTGGSDNLATTANERGLTVTGS